MSPTRDKGADGSIGDTSHTSSSDHTPDEDSLVLRDHDGDSKNEVHALDIDSSGPWPEAGWFDRTILSVVDRERARWLDPDDVCRLEYVIWNRRIYSRAFDFRERVYTGSDPHTNHAHFSGRYLTAAENDTQPWGVENVALSTDDKKWISGELVKIRDACMRESRIASENAIREFFFDAYHAAQNNAAGDAIYVSSTEERKREMRNARDTLIGVLLGHGELDAVLDGQSHVSDQLEVLTSAVNRLSDKG